jgi:RND family efflux transporter MFP subunit
MNKIIPVFFVSLLALTACKDQPVEVIRPVYTVTIAGPEGNRVRTFSGVAKAPKEIPLSFRVAGNVTKKNITAGTQVKKGTVLAELDPTDYRLELKQKQALLAEARAVSVRASADYERIRGLYEAGKESASHLDQSLAEFRSAKAQQAAAGEDLNLAQQNVNYTILKAEADGVIASTSFEVNQNVGAGQAIATLESGDSMDFEMGVPARVINLLSFGYPAKVSFEALDGKQFEGKVSSIGTLNADSTTYPIKVTITEPNKDIRPGMVGEATFHFAQAPGKRQLIIPATAVVGLPGGKNQVWLYDAPSQTVKPHPVQVGQLSADGIEIVSGLKEGDVIVTRGVSRLTEGMKVKLLDGRTA